MCIGKFLTLCLCILLTTTASFVPSMSNSKTLNGDVWLRAYDYELTEVGVKNLVERVAEEYCNNLKVE